MDAKTLNNLEIADPSQKQTFIRKMARNRQTRYLPSIGWSLEEIS